MNHLTLPNAAGINTTQAACLAVWLILAAWVVSVYLHRWARRIDPQSVDQRRQQLGRRLIRRGYRMGVNVLRRTTTRPVA